MPALNNRFLRFLSDGLVILLVTSLLILLIEVGLRIAGYGYPSGFLINKITDGAECYSNNIFYTSRFYPPELIRTPIPFTVEKEKDSNTVRIAIAGESAALGDPDYSFGFSRILKVMLDDDFPGKKFEIINTSITAINSNVIVPLVKETMRKLKPDLFIVYMGNNEVIGPFGPNSEFSEYRSGRSFIKFSIALNSTRIGQLVKNAVNALKQKNKHEQWDGMEMFLNYKVNPGDERLAVVHANFKANLEEITRKVKKDSKLILSTVSVNLRDCPPFYSTGSLELPEKPQLDEGLSLTLMEDLLQKNPANAEANFIFASLLFKAGEKVKAKKYYQLALKYDALKFRADQDINGIIKEVYDLNRNDRQVSFIDMSESLDDASINKIAGSDLFLEHVHFNFYGNYLMAINFNEKIRAELGLAATDPKQYPVEYYKERLAYTPFEEYKIYKDILHRLDKAPFKDQLNNKEYKADITRKILEIQKNVPDENVYVKAIQKDPDDWIIRYNYALYLIAQGIIKDEVIEILESVRKTVPQNPAVDFNIGFVCEQRGEYDKALKHYLGAIETFPFYIDARRNAATLMLVNGDETFERKFAESHFNNSDLAFIYAKAGKIQLRKGQKEAAVKVLSAANILDPGDKEVANSLSTLLLESKNYLAAIPVLTRYLGVDSSDFETNFKLGYCHEAVKSVKNALHYYLKANAIEPRNFVLLNKIGQMCFAAGDYPKAVDFFEESLTVGHNQKLEFTYTNLGSAYSKLGERQKAISSYRKALMLVPGNEEIKKKLEEELL